MPFRTGILCNNPDLPLLLERELGRAVERFRSFESIRSDDIDLLVIDALYFEGDESVQFFLSRIRKKIQGVPVLLAITEDDSARIDSDWFFDDLVFIPFRKNELLLRVQKLLGKTITNLSDSALTIGNIVIDPVEYAVYFAGEKLDFTYKEFELLRLFAQNRGKVFSRKELLATIWGVEYIGGTRTVDVHIRRLRGKLGEEFNSIIETVRNVGYRCRE